MGVAPAEGAQRGDDVLGHLAAIEPLASLARNPAQHLRLTRSAEDLPHLRCRAIKQIETPCVTTQVVPVGCPVKGHAWCDGHPLIGVMDRRCQHIGQRKATMGIMQLAKGIDCAGQGDGLNPVGGHARMPLGAQFISSQGGRGAARPVQPDHLLRACGFQQDKTVAANAGHLRLTDPQQDRPGNGGIYRVATPLQRFDGDLCCQRV